MPIIYQLMLDKGNEINLLSLYTMNESRLTTKWFKRKLLQMIYTFKINKYYVIVKINISIFILITLAPLIAFIDFGLERCFFTTIFIYGTKSKPFFNCNLLNVGIDSFSDLVFIFFTVANKKEIVWCVNEIWEWEVWRQG